MKVMKRMRKTVIEKQQAIEMIAKFVEKKLWLSLEVRIALLVGDSDLEPPANPAVINAMWWSYIRDLARDFFDEYKDEYDKAIFELITDDDHPANREVDEDVATIKDRVLKVMGPEYEIDTAQSIVAGAVIVRKKDQGCLGPDGL